MNTKEQWLDLAAKIGETVAEKNAAYGDSYQVAGRIMQLLFPDGISVEQIPVALVLVRMLDKFVRIANGDAKYGGEDPALDIAGYGLLLHELITSLQKRKAAGVSQGAPPDEPLLVERLLAQRHDVPTRCGMVKSIQERADDVCMAVEKLGKDLQCEFGGVWLLVHPGAQPVDVVRAYTTDAVSGG